MSDRNAFVYAATAVIEAGTTPDVFGRDGLDEIMDRVRKARSQIAEIASRPQTDNPHNMMKKDGTPYSVSVTARTGAIRTIAYRVVRLVELTKDHAAGVVRCRRGAVAPLDNRDDLALKLYADRLIDVTDAQLATDAEALITTMTPANYDQAETLAQELYHRHMDPLAVEVTDAVYVKRTSFRTDPLLLEAEALKGRCDAWLAAVDRDDPELSIDYDGRTYTCKVSTLMAPDPPARASRKVAAEPVRRKPGMIDHYRDPASAR